MDKIAEIVNEVQLGMLSQTGAIAAIQSLIAQRVRSENEALKQQGKTMAEALRAVKADGYGGLSRETIAKIGAVLPKGEGKCSK